MSSSVGQVSACHDADTKTGTTSQCHRWSTSNISAMSEATLAPLRTEASVKKFKLHPLNPHISWGSVASVCLPGLLFSSFSQDHTRNVKMDPTSKIHPVLTWNWDQAAFLSVWADRLINETQVSEKSWILEIYERFVPGRLLLQPCSPPNTLINGYQVISVFQLVTIRLICNKSQQHRPGYTQTKRESPLLL